MIKKYFVIYDFDIPSKFQNIRFETNEKEDAQYFDRYCILSNLLKK